MALSNRYGYMVLATGNKSEYAVGYSTLYGDMCGGYAPIKDVWKTDVFKLCNWRNENYSDLFKGPKGKVIPENIINEIDKKLEKEFNKELPIGVCHPGVHSPQTGLVKNAPNISWLEYKRFQAAPGPKVTNKAFGRDRRFPLTSGFRNWN